MSEEELEMMDDFIRMGIGESYSEDIEKYGYLAEKIPKYIKELEQENQQLNKRIDEATEHYNRQRQYAIEMEGRVVVLQSVLNEVREHCELMLRIFEQMNEQQRDENLDKFKPYDKIYQILDKAKNTENP